MVFLANDEADEFSPDVDGFYDVVAVQVGGFFALLGGFDVIALR